MSSVHRPARLYVVGVAWILIGSLHLLTALGIFLPAWLLLSNIDSFGIAMLATGTAVGLMTPIAVTISSIGFFRQKRWGRLALEVLTWFYCALALALCTFAVYELATWPDSSTWWIPVINMVVSPVVLIAFAALLCGIRSKQMREAFPDTA